MAGNIIGEAWVVIRPDLSGFTSELTAKVTSAIANVQAVADAKPITMRVTLDLSEAIAQLTALRALAGGVGGGGGGIIAGAAAGAAGDKGGGGGGGLISAITLQKLLGVGAGSSAGIFGIGAGLAGGFSLLSLAGLGVERVLTTIIGLVGSLAGALAGGLLLAIGAVGVAAVGMGSDLLVMRSVITQTKTLYTALETLRQAVIQYGAGSAQAAAAQQALNVQIQMLGNTAGVAAELALAKSVQRMNLFWQQATSGARVAAVSILQQVVALATVYIPLVAQAAQTNFTIISEKIKPLFAWLSGPQGTGIFLHLEQIFAKNLPTAIHAFTQGIELVLKSINFLSNYTGGLTKWLDEILTKANSPAGFAKWQGIMATLIGMFHTWWDFFKILAKDIVLFFTLTAGSGVAIVQALTGMLTKLHTWLSLTTTQSTIKNLFQIHKQQILDLLALLPGLLSSLGHIYLTVAPALAKALLTVLDVLGPILTAITSNAWGAWIVGLALILKYMGLLGPAIKIVAAVTGLDAVATSAAATATGAFSTALGILWSPLALVVGGFLSFLGGLHQFLTGAPGVVQFMNGSVIPAFKAGANVFDAIGGGIGLAVHQMGLLLSWITTNGKKVGDLFYGLGRSIVNGLVGGLKAAVNLAISALDILITGVNKVTGAIPFAGREFIPTIPQWKDSGGPVSRNTPYFVGGSGPELFVPNTSGNILSASMSRGRGGGVTQHNHFYGVGKETMDLITSAIQVNNRQLQIAMRS